MTVLEIKGRQVEVDDSFMNKSEEERQAIVDDIAEDMESSSKGSSPVASLGRQIKSGLAGAAQTLTMDHADEIGEKLGYGTAEEIQGNFDALAEEAPTANIIGSVGGGLVPVLGPAGRVFSAAQGAGKLARAGAVAGNTAKNAAIGAGYEAGSAHGRGEEINSDTLVGGAGLGVLGGGAGAALSRAGKLFKKGDLPNKRELQTKARQEQDLEDALGDTTPVDPRPFREALETLQKRKAADNLPDELIPETNATIDLLEKQLKMGEGGAPLTNRNVQEVMTKVTNTIPTAQGRDVRNMTDINNDMKAAFSQGTGAPAKLITARQKYSDLMDRDRIKDALKSGKPREAVIKLINDRNFFDKLPEKIQKRLMDAARDPSLASQGLGTLSNISLMNTLFNAAKGNLGYAAAQGGAREAGKFAKRSTAQGVGKVVDDEYLDKLVEEARKRKDLSMPGAIGAVGVFGGIE